MITFTRNLTFQANNLGRDATLMLAFAKEIGGMYEKNKFPICWKVKKFESTGSDSITVTYQSQLAFCALIVDGADTVKTDVFMKINVGQKTTMRQSRLGSYEFTPPEAGEESHTSTAFNQLPFTEPMGIGFVTRDGFTPVVFKEVRFGSDFQGDFAPVLQAYVTSQYREKQIIRSKVSTPAIWEQNLAALEVNTTWDVKFNATGKLTITRA